MKNLQKGNAMVVVLIIIIVAAAAGYYFFMMRNNKEVVKSPIPMATTSASLAPTATPTPSASVSTAPSAGAVKSFTVSGQNFSFAPNQMKVKKGDTVKITFQNKGGIHDFRIDEFNVGTPRIQDGQNATIEFVANKTGSFQYYCSVGTHRSMGMWGTLTVE